MRSNRLKIDYSIVILCVIVCFLVNVTVWYLFHILSQCILGNSCTYKSWSDQCKFHGDKESLNIHLCLHVYQNRLNITIHVLLIYSLRILKIFSILNSITISSKVISHLFINNNLFGIEFLHIQGSIGI